MRCSAPAVTLAASTAFAHPPSDILVKFTGTKVDVTVKHAVLDPKTHYVKYIQIMINGKKITDRKFTSQTDVKAQLASFDLPSLKTGDKVTIEADCSMYGDLDKELTAK